MGKILLVSWTIHPSRSASSILVSNIAKTFGPSEIVIAGEYSATDAVEPWGADLPRLVQLRSFSLPSGRGIRYSRWLSIRRLQRQLEELARAEKCTSILAIFPDELWMYVGYTTSRRLGLPFFTWFHNTYLDNRAGIRKFMARRLQPLFFRHAKKNFVISDGMNRWLSQQHPDVEFETLLHGFDIPKLPANQSNQNRDGVRFFFSGAVNASCWDACERLFKLILKRPETTLHISSANTEFIKKMGLDGENLIVQTYSSFEDFNRRLGNYDIMLLPHGLKGLRTETEYMTIFPTRTIPLLYSGRPILAHTPPDSFLTEYLLDRDCAEVVTSEDEADLERAIITLTTNRARVETIVENAETAAQEFDIRSLARRLRQDMLQP